MYETPPSSLLQPDVWTALRVRLRDALWIQGLRQDWTVSESVRRLRWDSSDGSDVIDSSAVVIVVTMMHYDCKDFAAIGHWANISV